MPAFAGKVELDIRKSTPDWTPFLPPKAPDGAPNVLFVVWDDVGYGTMDIFGGPVTTPTMRRIAERGVKYANFHTTALCSPTRGITADRSQRHVQRDGHDRRVRRRLPRHLDPDSFRERFYL